MVPVNEVPFGGDYIVTSGDSAIPNLSVNHPLHGRLKHNMARFGLTEDSDDELIPIQTASNTTSKNVNRDTSSLNKGKVHAARALDSEDDLEDRNEVTSWPVRTDAKNNASRDFSKYANHAINIFVDEDSTTKSRESQSRYNTTSRGEPRQPVRAVSGETTEDELDYDYNYHEEDYDEEEGAFQRRRTSAPPPSWPEQLGLEPHRVHVMQASLFRAPEGKKQENIIQTEVQPNKSGVKKAKLGVSRIEPREHMEKLFSTSSKLLRKHSRSSEGDGLRPTRSEECLFSFS